ncbi:ADP-ribosylation factor-like 6 interacting protein 1 [Xylocopa sonorina]|uniref:ADP-ribosylation factor-like 6 interacting protein 1 n=1 Tax=Xylocopa sonorina TaxID=1818115 RepID=UPI00403B32E6
MADSGAIEREKHMKQLKRRMECWRELILPLNSILLWERSWYPGLILGITTTIFFLIWMLEPAILTIISISLLILALIDYIVPPIISLLSPVNKWTGQKEKKLNEICQNLSLIILQCQSLWKLMLQTRTDRPNVYYAGIITCLLVCIWIGSTVNNLLLLYMAVNALLLMPGLRHKRRAMTVISYVRDTVFHDKQL